MKDKKPLRHFALHNYFSPIFRAVVMILVFSGFSLESRAENSRSVVEKGHIFRGHGGPVRAILRDDARGLLITASFDSTIIIWSLKTGAAQQVLRFHAGAVNALALLPDGFASAGEDQRIALWKWGEAQPSRILEGHGAPISSLALSPDGQALASSGWDGEVRLWPLTLTPQASRVFKAHQGNVNGVGFLANGQLISAGYDGTLRLYGAAPAASIATHSIGTPLNGLLLLREQGQEAAKLAIAGGADGALYFLSLQGAHPRSLSHLPLTDVPLVSLALSQNGKILAASGIRGALFLVDVETRTLLRKMEAPAFPLWSLAFSADGTILYTGGADRLVRSWSVATGEALAPILSEEPALPNHLAHSRGAEVFKACSACHSLHPDGENRAGPSLFGVMGRRIGGLESYSYSDGFSKHEIVWDKASIAKLFEIGPAKMTPGTKMPEQTINSAEDRAALVEFIEAAGR